MTFLLWFLAFLALCWAGVAFGYAIDYLLTALDKLGLGAWESMAVFTAILALIAAAATMFLQQQLEKKFGKKP
jgi:hypothetical protein